MCGRCVICGRAVTRISNSPSFGCFVVTTLQVDGKLQAPWPWNVDVIVGSV